METRLLIDNWMLQDVNQALQEGLSQEDSSEIVIDVRNGVHSFDRMPQAVMQIDALLGLLTNIVLKDELIVDDRFVDVWAEGDEGLRRLQRLGILTPFDFASFEDSISEPRKLIVDKLCVTPTILAIQKENERLWRESRQSADDHMSQLVWGGAGYLARSHVFETPYLGCPYRQALIGQTVFIHRDRDAVRNMETIINRKRARLFQSLDHASNGTYASFNLPPVAIDVIENSRQTDQLVTVAVQLREKYRDLRSWLGEYQKALNSQEPNVIRNHVRLLEAIADDIDSAFASGKDDSVTMSVGTSWLANITVNVPIKKIVANIRNRFGVRAMLSSMVFSSQGEASLWKLLRLFGERNSRLGMDVHERLLRRYSRAA